MSSDEEYIVEAIRDWRYNSRENCKEYLIKWQGYPEAENTWEREENLQCPKVLKQFIASISGKRFNYFHTEFPDRLNGFQRNAVFKQCIGADGPHESDSDESGQKEDKQKFYCLLLFEDSDFAEETTLEEFMEHKPDEAWKFLEQRLYFKRPPIQYLQKSSSPRKKVTKIRRI